MTECEEVAESMRTAWEIFKDYSYSRFISGESWMNLAREFVKLQMKGESEQLYDNVAEALSNG